VTPYIPVLSPGRPKTPILVVNLLSQHGKSVRSNEVFLLYNLRRLAPHQNIFDQKRLKLHVFRNGSRPRFLCGHKFSISGILDVFGVLIGYSNFTGSLRTLLIISRKTFSDVTRKDKKEPLLIWESLCQDLVLMVLLCLVSYSFQNGL
jgi:hypothetical protein